MTPTPAHTQRAQELCREFRKSCIEMDDTEARTVFSVQEQSLVRLIAHALTDAVACERERCGTHIQILLGHLPDTGQFPSDESWCWCWEELSSHAQDSVKSVRDAATKFLLDGILEDTNR